MSYSELGKDVRTIIQRLGEIERELQGQKELVKREYKIEEGYSEESFNELGAEGWELFIVDTHWKSLFIFRRKVVD